MWRTEKERKKTSSKVLLLLFQTWGNLPCFRTADALWGLRRPLPQLLQPTLKCLHPCNHFHFLLVSPQQGPSESLYFVFHHHQLEQHKLSGWAGVAARCEQEWLVECKSGEIEAKKKNGAHYILDNISLQDGKSEPVPSDYLPDTSSTLDNFLELFLRLCFEGRNYEL